MKTIYFIAACFGILNAAFQEQVSEIGRIMAGLNLESEFSAFGTAQDLLADIRALEARGGVTEREIAEKRRDIDSANSMITTALDDARRLISRFNPADRETERARELTSMNEAYTEGWISLLAELNTALQQLSSGRASSSTDVLTGESASSSSRDVAPRAASSRDTQRPSVGTGRYPTQFYLNRFMSQVNGVPIDFTGTTVRYREAGRRDAVQLIINSVPELNDLLNDLNRRQIRIVNGGALGGGVTVGLRNKGIWSVSCRGIPGNSDLILTKL